MLIFKYDLEFEGVRENKNQLILYINLGLSIVSSVLVLIRENYQLKLRKLHGFADERQSLFSYELLKRIVLEILILFLHPYPFLVGLKTKVFNRKMKVDIYYNYNDTFSLLSIIKYVYALNSTLQLTEWKSSRSQRVW